MKTKKGAHNFTRRFLGKKGCSREEVQWARAEVTAVITTIALLAAGFWYWKPWKQSKPNKKKTGTAGDDPGSALNQENHVPGSEDEREGESSEEQDEEESNDEGYHTADENPEETKRVDIANRLNALGDGVTHTEVLFRALSPRKQEEQLKIWEYHTWYYSWYPYTVTVQ